MRRKPRHLSPDERDLWNIVAGRAKPLHRSQIGPDDSAPVPKKSPEDRVTSPTIPPFQVGGKADPSRPDNIARPLAEQLAAAPIAMDSRNHRRMTRGKLKPEARLDLHGMTLAEAHPELTAFILGAQATGKRLVLVITGKGKDRDEGYAIPVRHGVLRHQVPQWLALPPLKQAVLQVTPAHIRHGGQGAYYVYLRRLR